MANPITPVVDTDLENIKSQLEYAKALRGQSLDTKGETVSGFYVPKSPWLNFVQGLTGGGVESYQRGQQKNIEQGQQQERQNFLSSMPSATETQTYDPESNPGTGPLMNGEFAKSPLQQAKEMQKWAMGAPRGMEGVQNFALQQALTAPQREAEAAQKREDRIQELQMKAMDMRASQAERLDAQRQIAQMQIEGRKETAQLVASLKASGAKAGEGAVDQDAADLIASRFIEGDKNALMGISRNKALHGAVMASIARQAKEQGVDAKELVQRGLEYTADTSFNRTVGGILGNVTSAANEASAMIPIASDLSKKVSRTDFPTMNVVGNVVKKQTGDPNVVAFDQSIDSLINGYARAINPKGVATVSDKKRAHERLNTAFSTGQFDAVVGVMQREMEAALKAPVEARKTGRETRLGTGEAKPDSNAEARAWLAANPNDPRAAAVRAKLEGK